MLYKNGLRPREGRELCAGSTANDDRKESRDGQKQIVREASTRGSRAHQGTGGRRGGAQASEDEGVGRAGKERREAEAAEEERRKEERDAKLRQSQEERAKGEERRARDLARRRWNASGGEEAAFEQAWPSMWEEMLKRRTIDADGRAREEMARSGVSQI